MGHGRLIDHMFLDGLEDAYGEHLPMGAFAEDCAEPSNSPAPPRTHSRLLPWSGRKGRSATAVLSKRSRRSRQVRQAEGKIVLHDELPLKAKLDKIPLLKPAFRQGGSVTAANSSSISDGAAALVLMRRSEAEKRGISPLATILAHATHAQAPSQFATAPIGALRKLMDKTGWSAPDVDLFEINEAFAVVAMAAMQELSLPHEKVNVHGGACALGHPIGASGARIVVTLLAALQKYGLETRRGGGLHWRRRGNRARARNAWLTRPQTIHQIVGSGPSASTTSVPQVLHERGERISVMADENRTA